MHNAHSREQKEDGSKATEKIRLNGSGRIVTIPNLDISSSAGTNNKTTGSMH